ncbi:Dolichyldiphosphatase 1 [Paramuricea clavata]|uniref:Dolichyldiphosphatase n=3 Tax=Paramuricea clavata TaxID=317549 RepID=A0A7D9JC62_PARCT|nr:Dolichyldiphosphatase 1 [Paramuricea clavata]
MAVDESRLKCEKNDLKTSILYSYLAETNTKWKPVGLTFVEYPEGDLAGKILAWLSLSPIFILIGFVAVIIFRRELHTVAFFLGCVLNEGLSIAIKHAIKEPRPCRSPTSHYIEYGMPSSHAAFVAFFTTYTLFFVYVRLPSPSSEFIDNLWRHLTSLGLLCLTAAVSFGRVYLHYHTLHQVLWGLALGLCFGIVWFLIVHNLLTQLFPVITSWKISEYFLIRDSTRIPSILWFEYTRAREEVRKRQRRKSS